MPKRGVEVLTTPPEDKLEDIYQAIFDLHEKVRVDYDGTDYQQGVKDGIRKALAIFGDPSWLDYTRGNSLSRDNFGGLGDLNNQQKENK